MKIAKVLALIVGETALAGAVFVGGVKVLGGTSKEQNAVTEAPAGQTAEAEERSAADAENSAAEAGAAADHTAAAADTKGTAQEAADSANFAEDAGSAESGEEADAAGTTAGDATDAKSPYLTVSERVEDVSKVTTKGENHLPALQGATPDESVYTGLRLDPSYACEMNGTVDNAAYGMIFHDGDPTQISGLSLQLDTFENMGPDDHSVEWCIMTLETLMKPGYAPDEQWAETPEHYLRKTSGYDETSGRAMICYTVVPKHQITKITLDDGMPGYYYDAPAYVLILTARDDGGTITALSEQSFAAMLTPFADDLLNVSFFETDYNKTVAELEELLASKSKTTASLAGADTLYNDTYDKMMAIFGTTDLSSMSDEELFRKRMEYDAQDGVLVYSMEEEGLMQDYLGQ